MKKKELLRRVLRAELRTEIHYQMLKETNIEVDKLKEQLAERVDRIERRHIEMLNYFHATRHPHINEINNQLND